MIHALGPRTRGIFELLRERIVSGELAPGARLPSHQRLAAEFGVAPMTMRHVLARLEQAGLVSRELGRGTFVRGPARGPGVLVLARPGLAAELLVSLARVGRRGLAAGVSTAQAFAALAAEPAIRLVLVELGPPEALAVVCGLRERWPGVRVAVVPTSAWARAALPVEDTGPLLVLSRRPRRAELEQVLDLVLDPPSEIEVAPHSAAPETLLSRLVDAALLVDRSERCVRAWNEAASALLGLPFAAEHGPVALDGLLPERIQAELRAQAAANRGTDTLLEAAAPIELPLVQPSGVEVWVEVSASDVGDGMVLLLVRDRRAQRASQSTLAFQAQLLEAVEQAVVATDPLGRIQYWNRAAERLYGWRADEVLGRNIGEVIVAPALLEQGREIMARLRQGASWSGEFPVQRRDGTQLPVLVTDSPIRDPDGRLIGIIGVAVDLTERKQAEHDRLERARLEGLLTAATEQLARLGQSLSVEDF
jgi:PAS domain S-box-containing protein